MESKKVRGKIIAQIQHMLDHAIIKNRRFLDDEQLIKSEQLAVLEEIFNANVRDAEIRESRRVRRNLRLRAEVKAAFDGVNQCDLTGIDRVLQLDG